MLTRRRVLRAIGVFAGSIAGAALLRTRLRASVDSDNVSFRDLLLETVASLDIEAAVGGAYLRSTRHGSEEGTLERAVEALRLQFGLAPDARTDRATLLQMLATAVKQDFVHDRICYVDGWYLSLTECRLAAVKHLLRGPSEKASEAKAEKLTEVHHEPPRIRDWGPRFTPKGQPFNQQPDGSSALWFALEGEVESDYVVLLGEQPLSTTIGSNVITARLPREAAATVLGQVGKHKVYLTTPSRKMKHEIGEFVIGERSEK